MSTTTPIIGSRPPSTPGASIAKYPQGHACVLCHRRKVKCDRGDPCSGCRNAHVECVYRAPVPPRRRKKRLPEAILLTRLRQYEDLLKAFGVRIDEADSGEGQHGWEDVVSEDTPPDVSKGSQQADRRMQDAPSPESQEGRLVTEQGKSRYLEKNTVWTSLSDEFPHPTEVLEESSEDEEVELPNQPRFNAVDLDGGNLIFGSWFTSTNLRALHPRPELIMKLWQTFLENVNPLNKMLHAPTLQQPLVEASMNVQNVSKNMEALLFAIYSTAVFSLSTEDCENMFGEAKSLLLARYQFGTRRALISARSLKSTDLVTLQAFTLFLLSVRQSYDPQTLYILTGVAVRIGQRFGLHRDGTSLGLPLFEVEMRRRLWWEIVLLDTHAVWLSGSGTSAMTDPWDTKLPLNVNDSDLHPTMTELPVEHTGPTEMMYCLLRYEFVEFLRHSRFADAFDGSWQRLDGAGVPLTQKIRAIDELETLLEHKYFRYCDPLAPLHILSAAMIRSVICRLRLVAYNPRLFKGKGAIQQKEKDIIFNNSLQILEYADLILTTKSTQHFLWHVKVHFPWDAVIYMLSELCSRTTGDEVDRAWRQVSKVFEHYPDIITAPGKALHVAIGNLTIKAWHAREAELANRHQFPSQAKPPDFISMLRSKRMTTKAAEQAITQHDSAATVFTSPVQVGTGEQQAHVPPPQTDVASNSRISDKLDQSFLSDSSPMDLSSVDWAKWDSLLHDFEIQAERSVGH